MSPANLLKIMQITETLGDCGIMPFRRGAIMRMLAAATAIAVFAGSRGAVMPSRARVDEFIAVVESGDHAGAIERFYTEDASMQENAAPPRTGRDALVAHERGILARMRQVESKAVSSAVEGDRVFIHWIFELTTHGGRVHRTDEVAMQEWRGDLIWRERFFYEPSKPAAETRPE